MIAHLIARVTKSSRIRRWRDTTPRPKSRATSVRIPFLILGAMLCGAVISFAQVQKAQGLTAQEYVDKGAQLYIAKKYAEAVALYTEFESNFGKSTEAQPLIRSTRFRNAMALVQLKKFDDALEAIDKALAEQPPLQPSEIQELTFWRGTAMLEQERFDEARKSLADFIALFPTGADRSPNYIQQYPSAAKIPEARMLIGAAWLREEKFAEAANHFASLTGQPDDRGRTVVLQLYALLEKGDNDAAMKLITEQAPHMTDFVQLVGFQTLMLDLGNRWLEAGEYRKAIACLQQVWSSGRLIKHQEARLQELESRLQAVEAAPRVDPYQRLLLTQLVQKVKRELETFRKIESFDAALRLRVATAYQAMQRYREAALIMEDMLARLPADKVVEQASVNLVQSWFQIERWPKVVEAAEAFGKKFPKSASLPLVEYLEGTALQKELKYDEAVAVFDRIIKDSPQSEFAPRARFMRGFTLLLAENNKEALKTFDTLRKTNPDHELAEAAAYWRGMAYSLDKQFGASRDAMDEYLAKYPDGQFVSSAVFRKAYCAQQLENYQMSIRELRAYLKKYPEAPERTEALVLLGDALMNEGEMEDGITAFASIPKDDRRFYEEGVFKVAKALKLMEEHDRLMAHMENYKKENPRSPRVAEAVYQIGWVLRQRGEDDKAREIYWDAIREHGNDPSIRSVDDLFPALQRLYKGDDAQRYITLLDDLQEESAKKPVLKMRALWAKATALRKTDPALSQTLMLEAAALANVQTTNPLLLADFADASAAAGDRAKALGFYADLIKWNPRAGQKDRALAALGLMELEADNESAALAHFDRFEREIPASRQAGAVYLAKAGLLEKRGRTDDAVASLEALLKSEYSSGQQKAEALYRIGDIYMRAGKPKLAIPYFQRIYVMHGRWREWVAKAYLASGQAFEKIDDLTSAKNTYKELTGKEDLSDLPETKRAGDRLRALGGSAAGANNG